MPPYELTPDAEKDLEEITRYTLETWGKAQALRYGNLLEKRFQDIANRTAIARTFSERFPQVLCNRCEHHYIFFLHPEGQKPCIVAVLHERMNLVSWLDSRMED
jgi:plasmid stabilization system protein ParE